MDLAQYRELAGFTQFGADVDASTRRVLESGRRMMAALRQKRYAPLPDWQQALLIFAVSEGLAADVDPSDMEAWSAVLTTRMVELHPELLALLKLGGKLSPEEREALKKASAECVNREAA
jgi:F-type H+-transporting ATPase subunit alpha